MKKFMVSSLFAFILFPFAISALLSQVKIGEIASSGPAITYNNMKDLLQALEKEYSYNPTSKFADAKIIVTKDKNYYLLGLETPKSVKIAVKMVKDSASNKLYIARGKNSKVEICTGCNLPECGIKFDEKGNPIGCNEAPCKSASSSCGFKTFNDPEVFYLERYLKVDKDK